MIDLKKIRGGTIEGQRSSFEQLVCHLARLDGAGGEFRRIEGSGGDGGVEALRILNGGRKIGYQAKYYTERDTINWGSLDDSVRTALTQHPELERYVVALPCTFTGKRAAPGGSSEGTWGKWVTHVKSWKEFALGGRSVKYEVWTAFEIEAALQKPNANHLIRYFFDQLTFTNEWLDQHFHRTIHDLHTRYSPNEHVDTESLTAFDVIYRRVNVRKDLNKIFEIARRSDIRSAVALNQVSALAETEIKSIEDGKEAFVSLGAAVDWKLEKPWPVCEWITSWYRFTRLLNHAQSAIWDRISIEHPGNHDLPEELHEHTRLYELTGPEVFGDRWSRLIQIDGSRAALFVGRAGAGKSHVLARAGETARKRGVPVIHVLGQHFRDHDPRVSFLKRLGLADWSFYEALSALNLAAEAANTRALLLIDALNEGDGIDIWRSELGSFISEVNAHNRIVLVMSCREEYLNYVVPASLIAQPQVYPRNGEPPEDCAPLGKLVEVTVSGFRTEEERETALKRFMDDKGIARPVAPVLDPEFFNPLFLTSVSRSMKAAKKKTFPDGLHGAREIFGFVLETKSRALGTRYDGTPEVFPALMTALNGLAALMVERQEDFVPIDVALDLIESAFKRLPIAYPTWLKVLEASDILRRDVEGSLNEDTVFPTPNEVIRFSFQRLQDNFIAEHLVRRCNGIDLEAAFEPDAPLAFLVRRKVQKDGVTILRFSPRWVGVLGALWAAVAEGSGKELRDLRSFFGDPDVQYYPADFRPVFRASVRERKATAFSPRTKELLDFWWEDDQDKKLAIILSTSCIPGHAWNAEFLMGRILAVRDRDLAWWRWFTEGQSELIDRAMEIATWSSNIHVNAADREVVRLAAITLIWLCNVANQTLRRQARNGLANLLAGEPALQSHLKERFSIVDDEELQDFLSTV